MVDHLTEKCKACTIKHLSAVLTALKDADDPLSGADFCGNLVHAANHFMLYDQALSAQMRELRLDAQNEQLQYRLPRETIEERLSAIILAVQTFVEPTPIPEPALKTAAITSKATTTPKKAGCGCRKGQK